MLVYTSYTCKRILDNLLTFNSYVQFSLKQMSRFFKKKNKTINNAYHVCMNIKMKGCCLHPKL